MNHPRGKYPGKKFPGKTCKHVPLHQNISEYDNKTYEVAQITDFFKSVCQACGETFYAYEVIFKNFPLRYWISCDDIDAPNLIAAYFACELEKMLAQKQELERRNNNQQGSILALQKELREKKVQYMLICIILYIIYLSPC